MRTPGAIIVAETDHAVASLITEILRDEGYTVSIAHNRTTTLTAVDNLRPALILLDAHIASLSMAGLHTHITRQHHHSIPIITTTTSPTLAAKLTGRDSWACLAKPFSLDALVTHVRHHLPHA